MNGRLLFLAVALAATAALLVFGQTSQARRAPAVGDLQQAYDAAARESGSRHDASLKILGVQCDKTENARYSCEVGFSLPKQDAERVYLDVALVEPQASGWKLLTGLCRRYN